MSINLNQVVTDVETEAPVVMPFVLQALTALFPQFSPLFGAVGLAIKATGSLQAVTDHLDPSKPADPRLSA